VTLYNYNKEEEEEEEEEEEDQLPAHTNAIVPTANRQRQQRERKEESLCMLCVAKPRSVLDAGWLTEIDIYCYMRYYNECKGQ
jgi:hypothetical protein